MGTELQTDADRNIMRAAFRQTNGTYKNEAALLAETATLPEGEVFGCIEEGWSYEVAASGATDHDKTTAGGDKLYRLYAPSVDFNAVVAPGSPTVAEGAAGNVDGTVAYMVTYVTADGETEGGGIAPITVSNKQVDLTNIPVSSDRRVIARKIYRSPDGLDNRSGKLVATISDNTTTTYTDDTAEGSLGTGVPWANTTGGVVYDGVDILIGMSSQSVAIGVGTTNGYASVALGPDALASVTTGVRNTGVGIHALTGVTTGSTNVGIGVHAGEGITTGGGNLAVGYTAGQSNEAGDNNTYLGGYAGQDITAGNNNLWLGSSSGQQRASGDDNVGIGFQAMRGSASSTGSGNVAIGRAAGTSLTTGSNNVAVGYNSGCGWTGYDNVSIGPYAGQRIQSGAGNVLIGNYAGSRIVTSSNRLVIDNRERATEAEQEDKSLVFGVFGADVINQQFHINALAHVNAGMLLPTREVTGNSTVAWTDHTVNCNGTASITLTLPLPSYLPGKVYHLRNKAAYTVVSSAASVIPIAGGSASTALLPATAGAWCTIQSNGTNWEIIAQG